MASAKPHSVPSFDVRTLMSKSVQETNCSEYRWEDACIAYMNRDVNYQFVQ